MSQNTNPATGKNPTIRLSIIRSQIDQQQQIIALLENRLQESILGGTDPGNVYSDQYLDGVLGEVANIYHDQAVTDHVTAVGVKADGTEAVAADLKIKVTDASGNVTAGASAYDAAGNLSAAAKYTQAEIDALEGSAHGSSGLKPGDVKPLVVDLGTATQPQLYDIETVEDQTSGLLVPQFDNFGSAIVITQSQDTFTGLTGAMQKGIADFQQFDENGAPMPLEQDGIRQLLYQARALMGELRVEEAHWNTEVQQEKERRKELGDFTKG